MNFNEEATKKTLEFSSLVLAEGQKQFEVADKEGKVLSITDVSNAIANEHKLDFQFVYGILGQYVKFNPEMIVAKGRGMGWMSLARYDKFQAEIERKRGETTFTRFTSGIRELGYKNKIEFDMARKQLGEAPTYAQLKEWIEKNGKKPAGTNEGLKR